MDLELSGKRILITGSYRGTGAGLARVMAREGATVWVHGFELAPAEAVAQSIRDEGFDIRSGAMNSPPRIGGADCKKSSISSAVTSGTTKS